MIAARFRLFAWIGGCIIAALGFYMASQRVAIERTTLAQVNADIVRTQADIDRLTTEVTARSRAGQREHWNYTLGLQAAKPVQYVSSGIELASLAGGHKLPLDPVILASRGAVQTVGYQPQAPVAALAQTPVPMPVVEPMPVIKAVSAPKLVPVAAHPAPASPLLHQASFVQPKRSPLADDGATPSLLHKASIEKIAKSKDEAKPKAKLAKADDSLLPSDLGQLIAAEGKAKPAKHAL